MNKFSRVLFADLDRAAAVVLALGLIVFVFVNLGNGLRSVVLFFSPISDAFSGHPDGLGSVNQPAAADLCFLAAALLFAAARFAGFWSHYRTMPIIYWATGDAQKHRAARTAGSPQAASGAPSDFESAEETFTPPLAPSAGRGRASATLPDESDGHSWRERLAALRAVLGERRGAGLRRRSRGATTLLLGEQRGTAPADIPRAPQGAPAGPAASAGGEADDESPEVVPTVADTDPAEDELELDRYEQAEAELAAAHTAGAVPEADARDVERDFEQDPDFHADASGDLDEWLSDLEPKDQP